MRLRHLITLVVPVLWAQSDSQKAIEVLRANCASCHGTAMQMSSLRVDSREALIKGGVIAIEITLTTPNAFQAIANASREFSKDAVIGVGTVLNGEHASRAIEARRVSLIGPASCS